MNLSRFWCWFKRAKIKACTDRVESPVVLRLVLKMQWIGARLGAKRNLPDFLLQWKFGLKLPSSFSLAAMTYFLEFMLKQKLLFVEMCVVWSFLQFSSLSMFVSEFCKIYWRVSMLPIYKGIFNINCSSVRKCWMSMKFLAYFVCKKQTKSYHGRRCYYFIILLSFLCENSD